MSGEIEVGDMVMITRAAPCCGVMSAKHGVPWVVERVVRGEWSYCPNCFRHSAVDLCEGGEFDGRSLRVPRSMLIKIDPPAVEQEEPAPPVEIADRVIA